MHPRGMTAKVHSPQGDFKLHSPLVGLFNLENLLCAVAIALDLGRDPAKLASALPHCHGAPGRLEFVSIDHKTKLPAVYVDYAHTPDAVRRACATLKDQHTGQLIVVLGCGGDRDRDKRPRMAKAAIETADLAIFTSDNPRSEDPEAILDDMVQGLAPGKWERVCDRKAAIRQAIHRAGPGDRVLVAGKGHEDYQIIGDQRLAFDDRDQARLALTDRVNG